MLCLNILPKAEAPHKATQIWIFDAFDCHISRSKRQELMHSTVTLLAGEYCTSDSPSIEKLNRKSIFGPIVHLNHPMTHH